MINKLAQLSMADRSLIGLMIGFLSVAALEFVWPHPLEITVEEPEVEKTPAAHTEPQPHRQLLPASETQAVMARPLFTVDRRPYTPPVRTPEPERRPVTPRLPRVEFELSAVIRTPTTELALLSMTGSSETHKLRVGEQLEGWTLSSIQGGSVELENGTSRRVLTMASEDDAPPERARGNRTRVDHSGELRPLGSSVTQ